MSDCGGERVAVSVVERTKEVLSVCGVLLTACARVSFCQKANVQWTRCVCVCV